MMMTGIIYLMMGLSPEVWADLPMRVRSQQALNLLTSPERYGSVAYEYEKNSYPLAMADLLQGEQRQAALDFLQQLDAQAHETLEVDFLSGFTLKGQIRKYFYFGDHLDPLYRQRMRAAMAQFTETDPLTRTAESPRKFWERSTDNCGTPVDCRNTDNLRAMRETSVYLMAEETGNEATRLIYKQALTRYVSTLLDIGMGEWESPTYHGHTTTAYLNLYDFARDPEVKQLAKDALDWLFTAAALKYWHGDWTGPAKRTHGNGAAAFFWLYFGDAPPPPELERDWIYAITSAYRPPRGAIAIAQRQFNKPIELLGTHPHYENWKPDLYGPAFYETLYFGQTFQLGSLAAGTGGDWSGFNLSLQAGTGTDELAVDATGAHQIAQSQNILIWRGQNSPQLTLPDCPVERPPEQPALILIACDQTWLAIHSFPGGFALEVSEPPQYRNFHHFQQAVLSNTVLAMTETVVEYRTTTHETLRIESSATGLPHIWRNREFHDWKQHSNRTATALEVLFP